MRPLTRHVADHALTTCDPRRQQTKAARGLRRAHAVRAVVAGPPLNAVSAAFHVAHAALRTWGPRCAPEGPQGVRERPRSGRPPPLPGARAPPRWRRGAHAPLEHGALPAPWRGRARATVFARATRVPLGRASVRGE